VPSVPLAADYLMTPTEALRRQEQALQGCRLCKLCEGRTHLVFGSGNPQAEFVCIGEGPGADEDAQGLPFVGRAGQLLTRMLASVDLPRDEVYICNTVKCFISPRVLIYTSEGFKPITNIELGDLVLTHRGRFRPVTYIRPRETLPLGSDVVRLTIGSGEPRAKRVHMTVTPEHPFLIDGEWRPASAIRLGDPIRALGDECEVCGQPFFVRYDRYDERKYRTCGPRCHNKHVMHDPATREKIRATMQTQYAMGIRDPATITRRANDVTRERVAAGLGQLQNLTRSQRHRSRVTLAANITAGLRRGTVGFGESRLAAILDRVGERYTHLFALPETSLLLDFCLPDQKLLVEVRGPGFQKANEARARLRFVEAVVTGVEHRRTRKDHQLYNIGVADDESYVAAGIVSHNCRPPGNRNPEPDEIAACAPFLAEQLATLQPKVILSLGSVATHALLKTNAPIGKLRGRVHAYGAAVLIPTFHPAFLLRNPGQEYKRMAWDDLKLAKREYDQRRTR
jgi:uracil-DNA glycosylase family 4